MWGNAQGWIFAGIIAVIMGAMLGYVVIPPGMTSPTGTLTMAMKAADLGTDPDTIITAPGGDCDAGVSYQSAAKHWTDQKKQFETLKDDILAADKSIPEPVKEIISAADCKQMTLFSGTGGFEQVINYHNEHPQLDSLYAAGELLNSLALLHTTDQYKDVNVATRYATAAFNLGRHLYLERMVFAEWMDGLTLMESASRVLAKVDPDRAQVFTEFANSVNDYVTKQTIPLWKIIGGMSEDDKYKYAGDMFQIAHDSPERMWRVEATLKLGKFKFNAPTRGDQSAAKRVLKQMAATQTLSPDPLTQQAVHTAALAGADLTIEDYRLIN